MTKKATKPRRGRKPHNARTSEYVSFDDLLSRLASEPRTVQMGDQHVTMPRVERLMRVMVDRALQGKVRDIAKLLNMMAKNPTLTATFREQMVIRICPSLANL